MERIVFLTGSRDRRYDANHGYQYMFRSFHDLPAWILFEFRIND